jgi:Lysozyme like domain
MSRSKNMSGSEKLSFEEIIRLAQEAGIPEGELIRCAAIAAAESGCQPDALGVNQNGSRDRGLWQINDKAHPKVSDDCAFNPTCAAQAMYKISKGGTNWQPWSAYKNGSYKKFLSDAVKALLNLYKEQAQRDKQNQAILQRITNLELLYNMMVQGVFNEDYNRINQWC